MLAALVGLAVAGVPCQLSAQTDEGTDGRPNIVVFLSDDMGWGQPGFNGGTEVATPNMDRIANEGVKLTQFYAQPQCSPTRASLLTGRYPWKTGMEFRPTINASNGMRLDERTIAQALRDAGYATWMVGKWHLGQWRHEHLPLQRGFDHHYGLYSARVDSFTLRRGTILDWHRNGRPVVETGYSTFLLADEAVQLIDRHDGRRPFFLYLPFGAVHEPFDAPAEYIEQYSHLEDPEQRAMLKAMDVAMGRVMDALDRKGALDDTLLVFLNDNGGGEGSGGNRPLRGEKGSFFEGGIRVPAALRWPGHIPAGSESDALLHVIDLFPTFARLAGADTGAGLPLDGLDAWEAIAAGADSPHDEVVYSLKVIRKGDWKLIESGAHYNPWQDPSLRPYRLYNIKRDPYENTDLATAEPDKVNELKARLLEHAHEQSFMPGPEPFEEIPAHPPIVYGANEQATFGTEVETALRLLAEGNPGPSLVRAEITGRGVRLVYDQMLDADSVPPASAFRVVVNPGYRSAEVTEVDVRRSEVLLTLEQSVRSGETAGLTYEVPAANAIRDEDGIAAVGVTWVTTLGASFEEVPLAHDGLSSFTLRLRFSEPVSTTASALVESSLELTGGQIMQARQVDGGSGLWELTVSPTGSGRVVLTLPVTTDCAAAGAVCTENGKPMSNRLEAVVPGPFRGEVSITAASSPATEGMAVVFNVSLGSAAMEAMTLAVSVTESGSVLSGPPPVSVTIGKGDTSATLSVFTEADTVVEADSTVTATVYAGGTPATASVTVEDDDTATFTVSAEPGAISEGESATLTLAISNGVTFAEAQTISLAMSGTASVSDYTEVPPTLALAAGASSVTATLGAAADQEEEEAETVTVTATLGGSSIGSATVTINSISHDATLNSLSLSGIDIGAFSSTVTSYEASVDGAVVATSVTATASHSGATVSIEPGSEVNLAEGANQITVTAMAEDGTTTKTYTVTVTRVILPVVSIVAVAERVSEGEMGRFTVSRTGSTAKSLDVQVLFASSTSERVQDLTVRLLSGRRSVTKRVQGGDDTIVEEDRTWTWTLQQSSGYKVSADHASASVVEEEDDVPEFTVSVGPAEIAEGESATVTVAITNGVQFREAQTIALSLAGTASASDYRGMPETLRLHAFSTTPRFSTTATLTAAVDQEEEEAETVTVTASHGGAPIGSATVTITSVSHDATLNSLSLSGIDIGTFSGTTTSYQASVEPSVETTTVTATASHSGATVSIDPGSEVSLAAGANEITVTVTAEDGSTAKTYTVTVTRAAEPALPVVSIAAVEERVPGPIGEFMVTRTGPTAEALEVRVLFATSRGGSGQTLAFRIPRGQSSVTRRVQAGDNKLVEDDLTVTWTLQEGEGYAVSGEQASASVVVEESDIPEFSVTAEPAEVAEGESATVTVAITNGVRFREAQTIALSVSGTASGSDYTGVPETVTLPAYGTSVTLATLAAVVDQEQEAEETVTIAASHGGAEIGLATVTIAVGEVPPLTARFLELPETHDGQTPFRFELRFSEEVEISYVTLRDTAFEVTGGAVRGARRLARPSNLRWEITLEPASAAGVVLVLPPTTDCAAAGAVCTAASKPLSGRLEATVKGPGSEDSEEGFALAPENSSPSGIWSDGQTAWVADLDDARLYAYRRSDGERQPGKDMATAPAPTGLWSDGETLWVAGLGGGLRAYRLADGSRQPTRDLALEANAAPGGVWSDGQTAWVSDWLGDTVHAYRMADGRREAGRDIPLAGGNLLPAGVWSDGETLWVADWRERLYAYRLSDGQRDAERDIEAGAGDTDPTGLWSGGGKLLSTGWEGGRVRAFRLPEAVAAEPGKQPDVGPVARAASLPAVADAALRAAIGAALGKAAGEAASPRELAGLEALTARSAGIRDLSGIEGAVGLKELDLGFNPLADLRPLAALPALESLNLDGAATDLRALAGLAGLRRLSLRSNGIDDLWPLAGLTSLVELDLGDNRIADLQPLASLGKLAVLRADRNRIADLWPLASLAGLEALELGANRVRDLQPLASLARLQTLRLGGNGLAELHPLSGLGGLRDLGLAGNAVEDLRALADLGGLRRLDLRGNAVGDLRPLRALPSLVWVHVGGSLIEDLAPLEGLPGLVVAGPEDRESPGAFGQRGGQAGQR